MTWVGASRRGVLRAAGSAIGGGAVLSGVSQPTRAQSGESWPQFGYDDGRTGHAPRNTGPEAPIYQQWRFETGSSVRSSLAVVGDTVYAQVSGTVYALSTGNGTEQWHFETGDWGLSSPAAGYDTVYVGSENGDIYGLDAGDGTERWFFETGDAVVSSPAVSNGIVYVGSGDQNVYALSAGDGTEQWRFETGDAVVSSPAVANDTVYVGSEDESVYALNTGDGTERWAFETGDEVHSSPAVVEGTVYIGSWDGDVYALNAGDGTEQWRFGIGGPLNSSPAVADGTVYVGGDYGNTLYALNAGDGTEQWRFETDDNVSAPAVVDGTVYVGSEDNTVYALNAGDGTKQWSFQPGDRQSWPLRSGEEVHSSPAVANGAVYVGSGDGNVYALARGNVLKRAKPVLPIVCGVLGAGGAGLCWYHWRRNFDTYSSPDSKPTDGESAASASGRPLDSRTDVQRELGIAENALEVADEDYSLGDVDQAIEGYKTAIRKLQMLVDRLSPDDDHYQVVQTTLTEAQAARERTLQRREHRATLRDQLSAAETDLATALEEHSRDNRTVARVRYRQARDRYDEALSKFDDGIDQPLRVAAAADERPPIESVTGVDQATVEQLRKAGIGTAGAIHAATHKTLVETANLDRQTARRLMAWAAIPCDDGLKVETASDIEQRRQLAAQNLRHC